MNLVDAGIARTPPVEVRRQLRKEVGFGCPVPGCGNPYLEYHHFDPPWSVRRHHAPEGMIALCSRHHPQADGGAYTIEQLRALKTQVAPLVSERFGWMRHKLLTIVGRTAYYDIPQMVYFRSGPMIWHTRDENGYLLLNVRMLANGHSEPRISLRDNDWMMLGKPDEFESPPSGKKISARYSNGDYLRIEFSEFASAEDAAAHLPEWRDALETLPFPLTVTEIHSKVGGTSLEFGPRKTTIPGLELTGTSFMKGDGNPDSIGFLIG